MTPAEKAKELVNQYHHFDFRNHAPANYQMAKQCALICVDKIMEWIDKVEHITVLVDGKWIISSEYWESVKKEIEKL